MYTVCSTRSTLICTVYIVQYMPVTLCTYILLSCVHSSCIHVCSAFATCVCTLVVHTCVGYTTCTFMCVLHVYTCCMYMCTLLVPTCAHSLYLLVYTPCTYLCALLVPTCVHSLYRHVLIVQCSVLLADSMSIQSVEVLLHQFCKVCVWGPA